MTPENEYKRLWEKYDGLGWTVDIFGWFVRARLERQFGDRMRLELDTLHLSHFPRRRKIVHQNLPEELVQPIKDKWVARAMEYHKCAVGRRAWLDGKLSDLAKFVRLVPTNDVRQVYEANTSTYRSQGWGAHKYAKQDAEREADVIRRQGFSVDVESRRPIEDCDYTEYRVMANCEPWQYSVCKRRTDVMQWAVDCWRNGTNPKVYAPFLPDLVFEQSCDIAMGHAA